MSDISQSVNRLGQEKSQKLKLEYMYTADPGTRFVESLHRDNEASPSCYIYKNRYMHTQTLHQYLYRVHNITLVLIVALQVDFT